MCKTEKIDGKKIVYHGSMKTDMKTVPPHKCKHEKAYVYATDKIAIAVVFGVKRKGENIAFRFNRFGKVFIDEFYENGFEDRFKGRKCYIYKLPKEKFSKKTEFFEVVSEQEVDVLDCMIIDDSAQFLLEQEKLGKVKIGRYKNFSDKKKKQVQNELEKAIRPYINLPLFSDAEIEAMTQESKLSYLIKRERRNFCFDKFPQLIEKLKKEN